MLSLLVTLGVLTSALGCGSKGSSSNGQSLPNDPIARTVYEFLDAIRTGNAEVSSSRLTPLALQRISENDMIFAPPASERAQFQVGHIEMYEADKAFVESVWTDVDADGLPNSEKMTWALKLSNNQWRISGMAAKMGTNQPPVLIDFENPGQLAGPSGQQKSANPPAQQGANSPRQASQPSQDPFR